MDRFPPVEVAGRRFWLPLAAHTATALAEALLEDDSTRRAELLNRAAEQDPPLTLWSVLGTDCWCDAAPRSTAEVAAWLANHALDTLLWLEDFDADDALPRQDGATARWAKLAGERIASAHAARRCAGSPSSGEQLYLLALLGDACQWLVPADADKPDAEPAELPSWLQQECASGAANGAVELDEADHETGRAVEQKWLAASSDNRSPRVLRRLAAHLRRLARLESDFATALEREKLDALKELAYGASHEINNPLANISTRAQTLLRDETDPERRKKLAIINSQAFRAHEMISDMMLFARPPRIEAQAVDLNDVVADVLDELSRAAAEQGTQLFARRAEGKHYRITADPAQLRVALKAVVQNALEAVGVGGRVDVALSGPAVRAENNGSGESCASVGDTYRIVVSDTGPGISEEVRRHLFDPFYSGREAGRGLGFGLSKCWRIITAHGGRIEVESEPGCGATFTLCLPPRSSQASATEG